MSILSTIFRGEKYIKQSSGYEKMSEWQLGKDVEYDDGKNGETKHGAIDGITSDINGTSDRVAASIKVVNDVDSKVPFKFGVDSDGNYGYIKAGADTVTPFKSSNENSDYEATLFIRSCRPDTNYFLIDVSDIDTIYYFQSHQGGTETQFIGYTSWDWDDPEGRLGETVLVSIKNSVVDTNYYWEHSLDVSGYQMLKIAEGYNWGGTILATKDGKLFNKVTMISDGGWSEMNYKIPSDKYLKFTGSNLTNGVVFEQRMQYRLSNGYGHKKSGYLIGNLPNNDSVFNNIFVTTDCSKGRYIWCGGNTSGASGTYTVDMEVCDKKNDIFWSFLASSNSSFESSKRTVELGSNNEIIMHRTSTSLSTGTIWSPLGIDLTNYNTLEVEVEMDQAGLSDKRWDNFIGFQSHYPGQSYYGIDSSSSGQYEIVNYDTDYAAKITLGNEVFSKKTLTLDISGLTGTYYPKITAGNAGFKIYKMVLK